MGGLGVKFQHFSLTLLVVLTTLTLPYERDSIAVSDMCHNLVTGRVATHSRLDMGSNIIGQHHGMD